jgi:Ca2+-binding EF-hand superfamily protein
VQSLIGDQVFSAISAPAKIQNVTGHISWGMRLTVLFALSCHAAAQERMLPLEVPARTLSTPKAPPTEMIPEMPRRPVATPTTPGGKLPQYQINSKTRAASPGDPADPKIRFLLALPSSTILCEATVTINGQPFRYARQTRVDRFIQQAAETGGIAGSEPVVDRLRESSRVIGRPATADEAHWLLSNWSDGPTVLLLNDNFQRFRMSQRPAFFILDRDRNGILSTEEIGLAARTLLECDLNRDSIVQFTEIAAAATDPRRHEESPPIQKLITTIDDTTEFQKYRDATPDIQISVAFDSDDPARSRMAMTAVATSHMASIASAKTDLNGITVAINGQPVCFSCVQLGASDQISLGAVHDGYPLLPELDPNDDGNLTLRELRSVPASLAEFDRNSDGSLSLDEIRAPLRVTIGLGPTAHRDLAGVRASTRKSVIPPVTGPEWFVRMDRNKDNDLTRDEFPGTDDQFATIDADRDELISAEEANAFDKRTADAKTTSPSSSAESGANPKER